MNACYKNPMSIYVHWVYISCSLNLSPGVWCLHVQHVLGYSRDHSSLLSKKTHQEVRLAPVLYILSHSYFLILVGVCKVIDVCSIFILAIPSEILDSAFFHGFHLWIFFLLHFEDDPVMYRMCLNYNVNLHLSSTWIHAK
jgi:hypothetical protein